MTYLYVSHDVSHVYFMMYLMRILYLDLCNLDSSPNSRSWVYLVRISRISTYFATRPQHPEILYEIH